jgi:hypothetical protein
VRRVIALTLLAGALSLPSQAWAEDQGVAEVSVESPADATLSAGCRTVDVARVGRDIFGFVVYKFHQVKRWCWTFPRITSRSVYTYVSDVDPNMEYRGVVAAYGNYYTWCCSTGSSGHLSYRQGKFDNCIWWFPCTRREYPWVKIYAHADGTYTKATGL